MNAIKLNMHFNFTVKLNFKHHAYKPYTTEILHLRHFTLISNIFTVCPTASYLNANLTATLRTESCSTVTFTSLLGGKLAKDICSEAHVLAKPLLKLQLKDKKSELVKFSEMLRCVTGRVVPNISKNCHAIIFRVKETKSSWTV
jgi:hypothetical protein